MTGRSVNSARARFTFRVCRTASDKFEIIFNDFFNSVTRPPAKTDRISSTEERNEAATIDPSTPLAAAYRISVE